MRLLIALIFMGNLSTKAQHIIPESIRTEAETALKHYPKLKETPIEFKFKKRIKKSIMQAQPKFSSLFRSKENRAYIILISEKFKLADTLFHTKNMKPNILIGWLGHELGHIMDYEHRSNWDLVRFGLRYYFSKRFIKEAERAADSFAVAHGLESYILDTKDFILNQAGISEKYRDRIKELYLSPDEIMLLVKEREQNIETE
ncbi:MAG: hypothetical protein WBG90_12460 [Saonia sp.]